MCEIKAFLSALPEPVLYLIAGIIVEAILPEYWRAKNTLQRGRVASKAEVIGDETWLGTSVRYGRSANTA